MTPRTYAVVCDRCHGKKFSSGLICSKCNGDGVLNITEQPVMSRKGLRTVLIACAIIIAILAAIAFWG
jgi:DnaJ-class molecular chaperone